MPVCDSSQGIVEVYIMFSGCTEGRWEKRGTVRASIGDGNFVHHRIVSAVKREEFLSEKLSYI